MFSPQICHLRYPKQHDIEDGIISRVRVGTILDDYRPYAESITGQNPDPAHPAHLIVGSEGEHSGELTKQSARWHHLACRLVHPADFAALWEFIATLKPQPPDTRTRLAVVRVFCAVLLHCEVLRRLEGTGKPAPVLQDVVAALVSGKAIERTTLDEFDEVCKDGQTTFISDWGSLLRFLRHGRL